MAVHAVFRERAAVAVPSNIDIRAPSSLLSSRGFANLFSVPSRLITGPCRPERAGGGCGTRRASCAVEIRLN